MKGARFSYEWFLKDGFPSPNIAYHGSTAFGTFTCGGGSSMGYKLAGYNHLGGVDIDPEAALCYKHNLDPKYLFIEDIREFNKRDDLPEELYNLALLDGSPPCSTFSMAGKRESKWGKEGKFREGQTTQVLDDLVFEYVATIKKLRPKVAILENVRGLIMTSARPYVHRVLSALEDIGYVSQVFLLNASSMGVPQARERVFIITRKKEYDLKKLKLEFRESPTYFSEVDRVARMYPDKMPKEITDLYKGLWKKGRQGTYLGKFRTGNMKLKWNRVPITITTGSNNGFFHPREMRTASKNEAALIGSFPLDYDFMGLGWIYLIGMSVPPVMTAQIANQIYIQWLSKM